MEKNIISYSFFTPKSINSHMRFWDKYNSFDRYWYNIPSVILINSIFYPEFVQRIHISKDIQTNRLFSVIQEISKKFPNVEIITLDYDYENTEPTLWRYKPLLDKECDLLLCRDIDSLPNIDELNSTYYFIKNKNFYVHTLRTHTNHATVGTIILAGLCGFRPKFIPFTQQVNFDQYFNHFKNPNWGLDQNSLIGMFVQFPDWTKEHFLDSPISTDYHKVGPPLIPCKSFDQYFYQKHNSFNNELTDIIQFLNEQTTWGGEPTDIRGEKLNKLLSFNHPKINDMRESLQNCNDETRNFYL